MPDDRISTSTLLQRLFKTRHIGTFIKRYDTQMSPPPFYQHLKNLCESKGVLPAHVIAKSGIERTFGHQLFNGTRNPSRDKVLQLAFGFEMNYQETRELLNVARKSALHPRIRRDAIIMYALENKHSLDDTQATLADFSLPLLGEDRHE